MKTIAFFLATLVPAIASAQETPTVGYAPVNGLRMYYAVHGSADPVLLMGSIELLKGFVAGQEFHGMVEKNREEAERGRLN